MAMEINIYMDLKIMTYDIFTLRSESESECRDMFLKRERVAMDNNNRYEHQGYQCRSASFHIMK